MRIRITETPEFKSGGGFKINKNHIGFCTPMTKSTCTGKRRQFAINAKHHFQKQQLGGGVDPYKWSPFDNTQPPQAPQVQQYMMDNNQSAPQPKGGGLGSLIPNAPGAIPDWINAGIEGVTNIANFFDRQNKEKDLRKKTAADWWNPLQRGSRGDYSTNYGYFKPDQQVPVQFPGAAGSRMYRDGGEYNLSQEEINNLADNYDVEYLD